MTRADAADAGAAEAGGTRAGAAEAGGAEAGAVEVAEVRTAEAGAAGVAGPGAPRRRRRVYFSAGRRFCSLPLSLYVVALSLYVGIPGG